MKTIVFFFTLEVLLSLSAEVFSQRVKIDRIIDSTAVWSEGHIELVDRTHLNGLVRYNKMTSLLQFDNGTISKALTATSVLRFEFYDTLQRKQRKFISYGFENIQSRVDSIAQAKGLKPVKIQRKFFEVLMEFPKFAVLHSVGPLRVLMQRGSIGNFSFITGTWNASGARPPSTTYSQTEMLYIFDTNGQVSPLLMSFHKERDGLLINGKTTKSFSKTTDIIMQRYTEPYFYQIDDWAYENKLSFEKTEDVLKMFEYYRTLIKD
ncbi:MAG: hypothetical protein JNK18_02785 [Cyclobacteriaceae bacterium]|nr:hypothetical protein [Cyclobacteriaceae bacterium]